jgi:hypothetical protein
MARIATGIPLFALFVCHKVIVAFVSKAVRVADPPSLYSKA